MIKLLTIIPHQLQVNTGIEAFLLNYGGDKKLYNEWDTWEFIHLKKARSLEKKNSIEPILISKTRKRMLSDENKNHPQNDTVHCYQFPGITNIQ